jgi:ABC-type transporter Mla subunit MlaD
MNLGNRSADLLLGLFVVGVAALLLVALVFTQGWNERRFDVLLLTESAEELDPGTKVLLEGLEIGRVTRVIPRPDAATQTMEFVATLRLRSRFPDGSELQLPLGTRAEITVYNLKATDITLRLPAHWAGKVHEGDTLRATRKQPPLDAMAGVADTLAAQMRLVLADSRVLMERLTRTIDHADRELASTGPAVRTSLATFDTLLQQTNHSLAAAGRILEQEGNRLGPMHDSLSAALSQARVTMIRLDTLAALGTAVASENRADVHSTLIQLRQISVKMDYYLDQLGQKPMRMFTGIRPYPVDTGGPIR